MYQMFMDFILESDGLQFDVVCLSWQLFNLPGAATSVLHPAAASSAAASQSTHVAVLSAAHGPHPYA